MTPETPENSPLGAKPSQAAPESALMDSAFQRADTVAGAPRPQGDSAAAAQRWVGKSLGKYQVIGFLGQGAAGVVLKAHDPIIERDVRIHAISDLSAAMFVRWTAKSVRVSARTVALSFCAPSD